MRNWDEEIHINVGTGEDLTIRDLAEIVRGIVFPGAELNYATSKPDGTLKKLLDVSCLHNLGWKHQIDLRKGIKMSYEWYVAQSDDNHHGRTK